MAYDINEPNIWFYKTTEEKNEVGVPRMKMLPGQYVPNEAGEYELCDSTLNVQSKVGPRNSNPAGTIFATRKVRIAKKGEIITHYDTMSDNLIRVDDSSVGDIKEAYSTYIKTAKYTEEPAEVKTSEPKVKPRVAGKSLIDELVTACPIPTIRDNGFYVEKGVWEQLLFNIAKGYNTMLVGHSGCGKTELTMMAANLMGVDIDIYDMAAKQDPIASLVGVHRFEAGGSVFDRADFTYAIEKAGIIVLDELPRAPMNTNNILFPVLDSRRELNMDVASHGSRRIKVNEKCRFIATANEGFEYTGNNVLDRALKERFQLIMIDYMPHSVEVSLLEKRKGVDRKSADVIVKVSTQIRGMHAKDDLSSSVSVRHTLYAADLVAGGMALNDAMNAAFLPMFPSDEERKKIKDLLAGR